MLKLPTPIDSDIRKRGTQYVYRMLVKHIERIQES